MNKEKIGGSFLIEETNFNDVFILEEFDETSKQMLDATREFVKKEVYPNIPNIDMFVDLQDNIVKRGTDQTALNYWLQINDIKVDSLPTHHIVYHQQKPLYRPPGPSQKMDDFQETVFL